MSAATSSNSSTRNKHSNGSYNAPNIDITKEEFSRISDAFKKEEFRKLFLEYCEEIQDPENRKLYEAEIKQFEAERGVDIQFINPEPGFVIKTSVDGTVKCFINVAKSAVVAKPTSEACYNPETNTRGLSWAIPMAQAAPRDDLDAQRNRCRVYDVIFHPDALYLAERNEAFHKCLIDTALDAVEREYKVHLDRANLKFPKMQFKGISRPTVIRKMAKNAPPEAMEPHPLDHISPAKPTEGTGEPRLLPMKAQLTAKPEFTTPNHIYKYRRDVDLSEYTNELDAKLNVTMPRELIVEIELPLLSSTSECQLDVTSKSLYLLSERKGAKYRLKLDLPYAVDDKQGNARFDTDMRRLCITLPVIQQNVEKQRSLHNTLLHLNREDSGVESDMRDEFNSNNSESPVEELSDSVDTKENDSSLAMSSTVVTEAAPTTKSTSFLKSSLHYQFPAKFDCNVLDNVMSLVLHVRNVQPDSISTLQNSNNLYLQFTSIGAGFYPTHYAFCMQLPTEANVEIASAEAEAWENNVVLNLNLATTSENLHSYLAGLDSSDLKEYTVQGKFLVAHNSRERKKLQEPTLTPSISLSSSLDISVERSECERSVEIEIKPREEHQSTCAANTTEDEEHRHDTHQAHKKMNKKQKKKNKKRRSLSESACDDIKAYQHQQQAAIGIKQSPNVNHEDGDNDDSSPERADSLSFINPPTSSLSVAVPNSNANLQQRKQRSYSECRDSVIGSSAGSSTLPQSFKGILKRNSRYGPRPSISDSCSSIDEYLSSYSCSVETGVANSLRFSQSFSDIPEENVTAELSESCKKTVRFNEVIKKQVFRMDSSILGQRKKNQKRRDRKQRALHRRLSEGDSADYEDNNKVVELQTNIQYFKPKCINNQKHDVSVISKKTHLHYDSGLDMSNGKFNNENKSSKINKTRSRLESESSSDVDATKNSMMFELDM